MAATGEPSLQDLLVIEDDAELLEFRCYRTGLPLWSQIRVVFFRMLMSDLLYTCPLTSASTAPTSGSRAATTLVRSALRNALFHASGHCRAEVCLMGEGVANQWIDGRWFNRLTDHFAQACADKTLIVEDHFEWRWPFPRQHQKTMFHAPLQARNTFAGVLRTNGTHEARATDLVRLVTRRSRRLLDWSPGAVREQHLIRMLARKSASLPSQFEGYRRMLGRFRPKMLLLGAACYGPAAALLAAANDLGVATAEYQHGAVSAGHDAYNFAPAVRDSEAYRRTLPRYFLGYGSWWNDQINAPVEKLALGNPHREARLADIPPPAPPTGRRTDLLLLSDGVEFGLYLDLARELVPLARSFGWRVVVRPHPLERTRVEGMHGAAVDNVAIDANADLYASLRSAHAVVSEVSTGLFEAAGLTDRLFIWDTAKSRFCYPLHPFQSFQTAEELITLLRDETVGHVDRAGLDAIWAPHWRRNYTDFLAAHGVRCPG